MTPEHAVIAWEGAVYQAVAGQAPVLGRDEAHEPQTAEPWVRTVFTHTADDADYEESGTIQQAFRADAIVYAPQSEGSVGDVLVQQINAAVRCKEHDGLYIGTGKVEVLDEDDFDTIDNFIAQRVTFPGQYEQE